VEQATWTNERAGGLGRGNRDWPMESRDWASGRRRTGPGAGDGA
jgi:hypothetical protein